MQRLKRALTIRRKKNPETSLVETSSKPHQWNDDERKVREGNCSFQVKYLGYVEVFESRGMAVCEVAMKELLKHKVRKKSKRAVLYVSGDALRVTEEISKGLIVDQVIEKVSFCAPVRIHNRGFAYICRDATTRRWLCHGFKAVKETGERLSHAVGCAFSVCLEKKQQREKDAVDVTFNDNKTSFTRFGSFKQASITERWCDPQSVIIPEPVSTSSKTSEQINEAAETDVNIVDKDSIKNSDSNFESIPRPRPSQSTLDRQSSLRIFPKLQDGITPFKRDYSLRIPDESSKPKESPKTEAKSNSSSNDKLANNNNLKTVNNKKDDAIAEEVSADPFHSSQSNNDNNGNNTSNSNGLQFNPFLSNENDNKPDKASVSVDSNNNNLSGNPDFFNDPFSAAPVNPAFHNPFKPSFSNSNFYSSMRTQPTNRMHPSNNNHINQYQQQSYFHRTQPNGTNNNSNQFYSSFHTSASNHSYFPNNNNNGNHRNISSNWSQEILQPTTNPKTDTRIPSANKTSHNTDVIKNPFDVSWVDEFNVA